MLFFYYYYFVFTYAVHANINRFIPDESKDGTNKNKTKSKTCTDLRPEDGDDDIDNIPHSNKPGVVSLKSHFTHTTIDKRTRTSNPRKHRNPKNWNSQNDAVMNRSGWTTEAKLQSIFEEVQSLQPQQER